MVESRYQLQEEKWKIHKYLEIKQHGTEQSKKMEKKIRRQIKNSLRQMKIKSQNLWNATNAVLSGKHIAIKAYFRKEETF